MEHSWSDKISSVTARQVKDFYSRTDRRYDAGEWYLKFSSELVGVDGRPLTRTHPKDASLLVATAADNPRFSPRVSSTLDEGIGIQ